MSSVSGVLTSDQITQLIQQASAAYLAPATSLQAQEQPINAQISALGQVQSALSGLQSALTSLSDVSSLTERTATVSPTGAVTANVTNDAAIGTYNLSNIHLAQAESLFSSGFASSSATLGSGSITIQVGGGSATTIAIASGQSSLAGIAEAIDQANIGVDATVVFDGSSYRLVLTGTQTGTAAAFTVSGSGALAAFSYASGASGSSGLTESQAAANASFSLNGIAVTSGSNTITGVIAGVTLTLAASGSATVQVTQSISALDQGTNSVVTALNKVLSTINQNASYSPTSGAGPLFGDVELQILRSNLIGAINNVTTGSGTSQYTSLASAGFGVTSGGTVTFDDTAFQAAAQANYGDISTLMQGLYGSLNSIVSTALASGSGGVTTEIANLNATITSMNQQIAVLQQQANQETLQLTQQFDAAQATLSQLSAVSSFLTTYFQMTSGG